MNQALKSSLNGVFSIYKPRGITSRDAANLIQLYLTAHLYETTTPWKVKQKDRVKLGIGGILDPIAEGVLGILLYIFIIFYYYFYYHLLEFNSLFSVYVYIYIYNSTGSWKRL